VTRDIPPKEMARLVQIDYDREMAFIAVAPDENESDETLASCGRDRLRRRRLELLVMVRSDLKRTGLGGRCCARSSLLRPPRHPRIVGQVLANNQAMLALGQKLGFESRRSRTATAANSA